ncbi:MAG: hypothetical protein U0V73_16585 [Acidimicrobiia bacterium]
MNTTAELEPLAIQLENRSPSNARRVNSEPLRQIEQAVAAEAPARREINDAVQKARLAGFSWALIGHALGVSRQSAHETFGPTKRSPSKKGVRSSEVATKKVAKVAAKKAPVK